MRPRTQKLVLRALQPTPWKVRAVYHILRDWWLVLITALIYFFVHSLRDFLIGFVAVVLFQCWDAWAKGVDRGFLEVRASLRRTNVQYEYQRKLRG